MAIRTAPGVALLGPVTPEQAELLTPQAQAFVATLHRCFNASSSAGAEAQSAASPPASPSGQWERNFQSCLELLHGPTDEKRFVGLLLAVRLLPQGGPSAVGQVVDALGWRFITRLLLPLTSPAATPAPAPAAPSSAAQQQAELTCSLGLSITSAACRLPDQASSRQVQDLVPALARVVVQGGVGPALGLRAPLLKPPAPPAAQARGPAGGQEGVEGDAGADGGEAAAAAASDLASVAEALECLVAVAQAGGDGGREALLAGGALEAGVTQLEWVRAWAGTTSAHSGAGAGSSGGNGQGGEANCWRGPVLAARLISLLVTGQPAQGASFDAGHEKVLEACVPALGHALGLHTLLALDQQRQQATQQQPQPAGVPAPAPAPAGARGEDAAMLQLECLHTLLLLLARPLPHTAGRLRRHLRGTAYAAHPAPAARGGRAAGPAQQPSIQQGWAAAVHRGLGWMLRSRTAAVQRHSALQLAAAMVDLLGPEWLLQPHAPQDVPLLPVLTEILHVECSLLLHDALHADAPVWSAGPGQRGDTRETWQGPQPSSQLLQELEERAQSSMDVDAGEEGTAATEGASPPASHAAVLQATAGLSLHEHAQRHVQRGGGAHSGSTAGQGRTTAVPEGVGPAPVRGPTAGGRAAHVLPAVLALAEAAVEALARDAAAEDGGGAGGALEEGAEGLGGSGHARPHAAGPCLPGAAAGQVLAALGRLVDELVAFLNVVEELQRGREAHGGQGWEGPGAEGAAPVQQQQQQGGGGAAVAARPSALQLVEGVRVPAALRATLPAPGLVLGCVRVVGRFLADVPDAHTPAMRRCMPFMLTVGGAGAGGAGAAEGGGGRAGAGGALEWEEAGASAVRFLLPGLLQATSTHSSGAAELCAHICSSRPALCALAATLCAACSRAEALAAATPGLAPECPRPVGASASGGAGTAPPLLLALSAAEQLLADAAVLLSNVLGQGRHGAKAGGVLSEATQATLPALAGLARWWRARGACVARLLAAAGGAGGPAGGGVLVPPGAAVGALAAARLLPRTLQCGGCLAATVLEAAAREAACVGAQQQAGQLSQALAACLQGADTQAQQAQRVLESAAALTCRALQLGTSLVGGLVQEEQQQGACVGQAAAAVEALAASPPSMPLPLPAADVLADMSGDGEDCWERTAGAVAALVELQQPEVLAALRCGDGAWLRQLADVGAQSVLGEVVAQSPNLQLLIGLLYGR